ncbi:MAG: MaoC family dehydratase N-terminal domain-containing protein, partial [Thaumarchaeota archaeon]|nr:MaoC family dehydratase N-terminal domain-containing protein [Nitrososphaerota archaeon]
MGKYFEEFNVGEIFTTARRTITESDIALFAGLSGDYNPLHTDSVFAGKTVFKTRIAHGLLTLAVASGLHFRLGLGEETLIALLGVNNLRFVSAVRAGDTLHCVVKVKEKK